MSKRRNAGVVEISVGFAADGNGAGLAYASLEIAGREALLRVPFVQRSRSGDEREAGYGALRAVADAVRERYDGDARFIVADQSLVTDLGERRALPAALTMPYVALRCSLNRYASAQVVCDRTPAVGDLAARARAEVSLHVAA